MILPTIIIYHYPSIFIQRIVIDQIICTIDPFLKNNSNNRKSNCNNKQNKDNYKTFIPFDFIVISIHVFNLFLTYNHFLIILHEQYFSFSTIP